MEKESILMYRLAAVARDKWHHAAMLSIVVCWCYLFTG